MGGGVGEEKILERSTIADAKATVCKLWSTTLDLLKFKTLAGQLATVTECERYAPIARVGGSLSL